MYKFYSRAIFQISINEIHIVFFLFLLLLLLLLYSRTTMWIRSDWWTVDVVNLAHTQMTRSLLQVKNGILKRKWKKMWSEWGPKIIICLPLELCPALFPFYLSIHLFIHSCVNSSQGHRTLSTTLIVFWYDEISHYHPSSDHCFTFSSLTTIWIL